MCSKAIILKTNEVKVISEIEVFSGEKIYYMSDKTSYSENQISIISKKRTFLEKILMVLSISTKKLENQLEIKLNKELKRNEELTNLFNDENFLKRKNEEFELLIKTKYHVN